MKKLVEMIKNAKLEKKIRDAKNQEEKIKLKEEKELLKKFRKQLKEKK